MNDALAPAFVRSLGGALAGLAELLWPSRCAACDAATVGSEPLCACCAGTLERVAEACPRCALPLRAPHRTDGARPDCLSCQRAPPRWRSARAPFVFGGELAVAIRRWKLGRRPELTGPLARLAGDRISTFLDGADAIVPVPLHPRRLRAREFNQASLLARALAREHRTTAAPRSPPVEELLDRVRDTPAQATLSAAVRRRNLAGAFRAPRPARVAGRRLVLVDDVLTTGATADACAIALYDAGARSVDVAALARALP